MKYVLVIIVALISSFAITALLTWGVCWAFGLTFSFKIAFGVWLLLLGARTIFGGNRKN